MTGENFCWLIVGFIAGRFVGDSVKNAITQVIKKIRAKGQE